jgi:hypothetical protein
MTILATENTEITEKKKLKEIRFFVSVISVFSVAKSLPFPFRQFQYYAVRQESGAAP